VIKKFSSAGKEGIDVLCRCLNDVFSTRAEMWSLLYVAREINQSEMDVQLISTFERILVECPGIVKGYPKPPAWMPSLRPLLMGGGQYGWDDGTWLRVAHSLAEYLLDIIPQLPADLSAEHAEKLSQGINHYIEKLEILRGHTTLKENLEKEINYWKSLKAKFPR
jgi:hypothetical protein